MLFVSGPFCNKLFILRVHFGQKIAEVQYGVVRPETHIHSKNS